MLPFSVRKEAFKVIGGWQESILSLDRSSGREKVFVVTPGGLYNEGAFRYLLKSEFHRSQRSGLAHYLLLLYQDRPEGVMTAMPVRVIESVVRVLSRGLRETDYIGWFREGQVVGGVLTAMGRESGAEQIESLRARIVDALRDELGDRESDGLRVRIRSYDEWAGRAEREFDCIMDN